MVQSNCLLLVITGIGFLQLDLDCFEFAQLIIGDVDSGPRGQLSADVSLHVRDVGDVAPGYRQHHEPAAGQLGDQAFGPQREQRFTHRRDADAQLGGQLVQPDVGPRGVTAVEDPATDQARNVVGKLGSRSEIRGTHSRHT